MADDRDRRPASLEPPSLEPRSLFRRRKKTAEPMAAVPAAAPVQEAPDDTPVTIFDDTSEPTPVPAPVATAQPEAAAQPRPQREPWLGGTPAAALTGLVVGAVIVGATAGALRICTAVKGTSSCGGQGFFLLVAILVVAVLVGSALLRMAGVPEPGSTSFLAVGLLSVVTLLFLVGSIFEWWMAIVIPLASVATFLLSHWVSTTFVESS
ncbi:MAG TPA: hypothetical protein VFV89_07760 [Nocardioides sp.]|uniref:hypothetical protein n=1 Tax=Nocardioides sp. TaxID=35761 RepID=UPI002E345BFC|nr:hypothetical protein [Nocardioides sp.]HEX5087687.1 hypothetical protein [Nocardioides sp.]